MTPQETLDMYKDFIYNDGYLNGECATKLIKIAEAALELKQGSLEEMYNSAQKLRDTLEGLTK